MNLFSELKKDSKLALVFDLGSSSVGAALFLTKENEGPQIIFSIREPIDLADNIYFDKFLASTMHALDTVAGKVILSGIGAPKKFFCVLSSPWYSSQVRLISLKKNASFLFTEKLGDELIKKEVNLFEEENKKNGSDFDLIELKNMRTTLNGYMTKNPVNQKTKDIEMAVFMSMVSKDILNNIKAIIDKHFHQKDIKFSSFSLASFFVARDIFVHQDNFTLVDIGGEVTELALVKKDALCSSVSFPIGYNYFIRGVANSLNCTLSEAKSYLSLYKDNHAAIVIENKLKPIIEKLKLEWLSRFQESLVLLSNDIFVSSTVFMTVDEELVEFFADTIKNEEFNQYAFTESKFNVIYLGTQMLHGIADYANDIKRDPFITIESIYINRFLS